MNTNGGAGLSRELQDGNNFPNSTPGGGDALSEENRRVLEWISQVLKTETRESALLELSKKREQVPELALILWYSFGMMHEQSGWGVGKMG
jgi:hypothetical protein